jgi:hypothetical protein
MSEKNNFLWNDSWEEDKFSLFGSSNIWKSFSEFMDEVNGNYQDKMNSWSENAIKLTWYMSILLDIEKDKWLKEDDIFESLCMHCFDTISPTNHYVKVFAAKDILAKRGDVWVRFHEYYTRRWRRQWIKACSNMTDEEIDQQFFDEVQSKIRQDLVKNISLN